MQARRKLMSVLTALAAAAPGGCRGRPAGDAGGLAVLVVVLRRPPRRGARRPRDHRLRGHRRAGPCWRTTTRPRAAPAADRVRAAGGRRPQQPEPRVLPRRLFVFSSPHSGYLYPRDRRSRSATASRRGDGAREARSAPSARCRSGGGCELGYTYPNPVVAGERLYLFMRGPCWTPYFTSTADGIHWSAPRTLVSAPPSSAQDGGGSRRVRPYAKYAAAPDGSVLMTFSDGHPASFKSSLYFLRFQDGRFVRADGSVVGTMADLPFRFDQLDRVHAYGRAPGAPGRWTSRPTPPARRWSPTHPAR